MIILVGKSASGKTVIGKYLIDNYGFRKFVTTTTRHPRIGETNHIDYHFIDIDRFKKEINEDKFIEYAIYNDNYYGSYKSEIADDKILIVEPNGLYSYLKLNKKDIVTFYIDCNKEIRKQRMIDRQDKIEDIEKRLSKDDEVFKEDLKDKVDFVITNNENDIKSISEEVYKLYKSK